MTRGVVLNSLEDFQDFIDSNNIKSKKEFREKEKYLYDRYIRLFPSKDRNLKFKEEGRTLFGSTFKTIEDFQTFIDENNILRPKDLRDGFPKIYDRMLRILSEDDKQRLVYNIRVNSYKDIKEVEDLQNFINDNNIHGRKELHKKFPGLYVKFHDKLDKIIFNFNNYSLGENYLMELFSKNNIDYITQKTFPDLKKVLPLRYDFYLPKHNVLIEHQGEGHFGQGRYYSESLIENDKIKYEYSIKNNIPLFYFTLYKYEYEKFGYFTEVITDDNILINRIKQTN